MKDLKVIIIENEYEAPSAIKGLIKDNPTIISTVEEINYARHRPELVIEALEKDIDAILAAPSYTYMDQLENTVGLLKKIEQLKHKSYFLFIFNIIYHANEIIATDCGMPKFMRKNDFKDFKGYIETIKEWAKKGLLFDITEDHHSDITYFDDLHGLSSGMPKDRQPWVYKKVVYSEELNIFHFEDSSESTIAFKVSTYHK